MDKLKNRSFLLRIIGTLLAIILLVYLLAEQGWAAILAAVKTIPPLYLLLAFGLVMISRMAVVARWHTLLKGSGLQIRFGQTVRITFAGLFAANFLPTTIGGDVVRLAGAVRLKFDAALSTASLIADRLVGMFGMALALPLGIPSFIRTINAANPAGAISTNWIGTTGFLSLLTGWERIWKKVTDFWGHLTSALAIYLKRPGSLLIALVYSIVHMACIFTIIYLLFKGEGQPISWGLIAGLYSLVYFVTLLPISINGYGLQELSMTLIFSRVAGVSIGSSLTVALLLRTMMMIASLPGAFFISGILAGEEPGSPETRQAVSESDSRI